MGNFTTADGPNTVELFNQTPKTTTIELIRQYARVCSPLTTIPFFNLITN